MSKNPLKFRKADSGYVACHVRKPGWYKNPALSKAQVRNAIEEDAMKIFNFMANETPELVCLRVYGALDMIIKKRRGNIFKRTWMRIRVGLKRRPRPTS